MALAIYMRGRKKVRKMKSEIERKFNLKTLLIRQSTSEIMSLHAKVSESALLDPHTHSYTYFYDNEILCEKQSDYHMSPLVEKKIIVLISI